MAGLQSDSVGPNWQSGKNPGVLGVYLAIILRRETMWSILLGKRSLAQAHGHQVCPTRNHLPGRIGHKKPALSLFFLSSFCLGGGGGERGLK